MEEMHEYVFLVRVNTETRQQALNVMGARLGHDEDYGFPYDVTWMYVDTDALENAQRTED